MNSTESEIFGELEKIIKSLSIDTIPKNRKEILKPLIDYIQTKVNNKEEIKINFICTHNSRRSHLSQIWMQTLAKYFNINSITCYSGGTETTAIYKSVIGTLEELGFQISKLSSEKNPVYAIKYGANELPIIGYSKKLDDDFNPKSGFIAIMTCDSASEACPFVSGAEMRLPITYRDPKEFDNSPLEKEKYKERSLQIATEFFYVLSKIKK